MTVSSTSRLVRNWTWTTPDGGTIFALQTQVSFLFVRTQAHTLHSWEVKWGRQAGQWAMASGYLRLISESETKKYSSFYSLETFSIDNVIFCFIPVRKVNHWNHFNKTCNIIRDFRLSAYLLRAGYYVPRVITISPTLWLSFQSHNFIIGLKDSKWNRRRRTLLLKVREIFCWRFKDGVNLNVLPRHKNFYLERLKLPVKINTVDVRGVASLDKKCSSTDAW